MSTASDLSQVAVETELARLGATLGKPFCLQAETGSTNDDARQAANAAAPHGAAFFAESQSAGRGRGSHRWFSPPGANLYGSVLLRPDASPQFEPSRIPAITLAFGVAVARSALAFLSADVRLKWPNDVLVHGRKLAGILVEATFRGARPHALIVGVGMNVHQSEFPDELDDRATSLVMAGARECDRSRIAARLLLEIEHVYDRYRREGLGAFAAELDALDGLRGRAVSFSHGASEPAKRGVADGVDAEGRLRVRLPDEEIELVTSGAVELVD